MAGVVVIAIDASEQAEAAFQCKYIYLPIDLPTSTYLHVHAPIYLSIYLPTYLPTYQPTYLSMEGVKTRHSTLESVSPMARKPHKAVGPMYIGRANPEHVKYPRAPVDKSRVLIPCVTGQIPELLRIAVKLHRHHYR